MSPEAPTSWEEVLETLEGRLELYRNCLAGGEPPDPFHLPTHLGPMPTRLAARARAILEVNRGVEAALEARRDQLARALRATAAPVETTPPAAFFDAVA